MKNYLKEFYRLFLLTAFIVFALTGCEGNPTDIEDYEPEPMLAAYIYNGEPVTEVYLEWTDYFLGSYNYDDQVITGADIRIYPMNADGTLDSANVIVLIDDAATPGHYIASDMNQLIEGLKSYKIVCEKPLEEIYLESYTTVPGDYDMEILPPGATTMQPLPAPPTILHLPNATDSLTREAPEIFLDWTLPDSNGGFVINYLCLVDTADLVPLDPDFIIGEDVVESEDKSRLAIELILAEQEQYTISWLMFEWVGTYEITAIASCLDYFNYVNYGMTVMMGFNIDLPTNIQGGKGIFAGLNRHTFKVTLKRVD